MPFPSSIYILFSFFFILCFCDVTPNIIRSSFYYTSSHIPDTTDITLVTHLSVDRFDRLKYLDKSWNGPISASIVIHLDSPLELEFWSYLTTYMSSTKYTDIHIVFLKNSDLPYPNNVLRQLASSNSRTDTIFLIDVDFFLPSNIYNDLLIYAKTLSKDAPTAFVIPAFEIENKKIKPPLNFNELKNLYLRNQIQQFHLDRYQVGHRATLYDLWLDSNDIYPVDYEKFYEPYVMIKRPFPVFAEQFNSGYFDKQSHCFELYKSGYSFEVLPHVFIVHVPHDNPRVEKETPEIIRPHYLLFQSFEKELNNKYSLSSFSKNKNSLFGFIPSGYIFPGLKPSPLNLLINPSFFHLDNQPLTRSPFKSWHSLPCPYGMSDQVFHKGPYSLVVPVIDGKYKSEECGASQIVSFKEDFKKTQTALIILSAKVRVPHKQILRSSLSQHEGSPPRCSVLLDMKYTDGSYSNMNRVDFTQTNYQWKEVYVYIYPKLNSSIENIFILLSSHGVSLKTPCYFDSVQLLSVPTTFPNYRVYPNFLSPLFPKTTGISVVTHTSLDRFDRIIIICQYWNNPISVSVYITDISEIKTLKNAYDKSPCAHTYINVHLVFNPSVSYPINFLRNLALDNAPTSYVLLIDSDLIPVCSSQAPDILFALKTIKPKEALILPSFMLFDLQYQLPKNKKALKEMLKPMNGKKIVQPFDYTSDTSRHFHGPTDYEHWLRLDAQILERYSIEYRSEYEPFIIINRHLCPHYDNRFRDYGFNKISFIYQLNQSGIAFSVLPQSFLIHLPHAHSNSRKRWNKNIVNMLQSWRWFMENIHKPLSSCSDVQESIIETNKETSLLKETLRTENINTLCSLSTNQYKQNLLPSPPHSISYHPDNQLSSNIPPLNNSFKFLFLIFSILFCTLFLYYISQQILKFKKGFYFRIFIVLFLSFFLVILIFQFFSFEFFQDISSPLNTSPFSHSIVESKSTIIPFRIYIYMLPKRFHSELAQQNPRCISNIFGSEVAIHQWLLNSPLRTLDPEEADFFFLPIYSTCFRLQLVYEQKIDSEQKKTLAVTAFVQEAVDMIRQTLPYWNRYQGQKHIVVLPHDFSRCFTFHHSYIKSENIESQLARNFLHLIQNMIVLSPLGDLSTPSCFHLHQDIVIPPYLPPINYDYSIHQPRKTFVYFRGKIINKVYSDYSGGIRQRILELFSGDKNMIISAKRVRHSVLLTELFNSTFCLCPPGFTFWTPRLSEAMITGCIPVFINAQRQILPFSHFINYSSFSLFVSSEQLVDLKYILHQVTPEKLKIMRENLHKYRSMFLYTFNHDLTGQPSIFDMITKELEIRRIF